MTASEADTAVGWTEGAGSGSFSERHAFSAADGSSLLPLQYVLHSPATKNVLLLKLSGTLLGVKSVHRCSCPLPFSTIHFLILVAVTRKSALTPDLFQNSGIHPFNGRSSNVTHPSSTKGYLERGLHTESDVSDGALIFS